MAGTIDRETIRDDIEGMIDRLSLYDVLDAVVEICELKAEHLESNWQDATSAKRWRKYGKMVSGVCDHLE